MKSNLVIFYLSGVPLYIINLFKKRYKYARHIQVSSEFHSIDREHILQNNEKLDSKAQCLIVQSLVLANDHFIELMNLLILQGGCRNISVFMLYMAYGHRVGGVKDFMISSIKALCNNLIILDINKVHDQVLNINVCDSMSLAISKEVQKNSKVRHILVGIDCRSLQSVKKIADILNMNYVFWNKRDDILNRHDILFHQNPSKIDVVHIIDDVLYTGQSVDTALQVCDMIGVKERNVYVTHKLSVCREGVKYHVINSHNINVDDVLMSWDPIFSQLHEYLKVSY